MIKKQDHFIIAGLGLEFALIMCAGFFGGRWLDKRFDAAPWCMLALSAIAFAFAVYIVVKSATAVVDKDAKKPATAQKEEKK